MHAHGAAEAWLAAGVGGDEVADLDLRRGRSKRLTPHSDLFFDRRSDL